MIPQFQKACPNRCQSGRRVVISGTILGLGGIRTHLVHLMKHLRLQQCELLVLATNCCWDRELLHEMRSLGIRFVLPPNALRACRRLAAMYSVLVWPLVLPVRASSVYCVGAGRSHLLMQRLCPRGAVSVNHEIVVPPGPASLAGTCAARLDTTVANSQAVAKVMRQHWPHKPVRVIPFLTSDSSLPAPVRQRGLQNKALRVTYLGRLVAHKRPQELVKRWQELSAEWPSACLDVYGFDPTGEMLAELRQFVSSHRLGKWIRIHGEYSQPELPGILAATDLVVLPSLDEGLPLVLVEAMARGVPFVATAAGGTAELGEGNPDVVVTGTSWRDFEAGFRTLAANVCSGQVDPLRLHAWAERRYGHAAVADRWRECLLQPRKFFELA